MRVYQHYPIAGLPRRTSPLIVSRRRLRQERLHRNHPPAGRRDGAGPRQRQRWRPACRQLYHEHKRGIEAGYAKFETFPIWNLPLKHPVNLAYEAATADLNDVNMIDPFHLEAYGMTTVNYNRDIEIFPVLNAHLRAASTGDCPYKIPDGHGRQHGGLLHRRRRSRAARPPARRSSAATTRPPSACARARPHASELHKQEMLLNSLHLDVSMRKAVPAARAKAEQTGNPAVAIELPDGRVITGKTSGLMGASCAALLNSLKTLANIRDNVNLISPMVHRADPALKGRASWKHEPAAAHRRGAHRPFDVRRYKSHRGARHGGTLPLFAAARSTRRLSSRTLT